MFSVVADECDARDTQSGSKSCLDQTYFFESKQTERESHSSAKVEWTWEWDASHALEFNRTEWESNASRDRWRRNVLEHAGEQDVCKHGGTIIMDVLLKRVRPKG